MRNAIIVMFVLLVISLQFAIPTQAKYPTTYPTANTNEGYTIDGFMVGDRVYLVQTTAIYEYNITTNYFQKVFDIGLSYIITSIVYNNGSFYISAYKLMNIQPTNSNNSNDSDGVPDPTHPVPPHDGFVVTCPLHYTQFYATNFTVFKLSASDLHVENEIVVNKTLYVGKEPAALRAMKIIYADGKILGYITGIDYSNLTSYTYIYEFDLALNASNLRLTINDKTAMDMIYSDQKLYLLEYTRDVNDEIESGVVVYDTVTWQKDNTYLPTTRAHRYYDIDVDSEYVYIVGKEETASGGWNAELTILDRNLTAIAYSHLYNMTSSFEAVKLYGGYVFVAGAKVYQINWQSNRIEKEYDVDFNYTYDIRLERTIHISSARTQFIIPYKDANHTTNVFWGGYFKSAPINTAYRADDEYIYAFFVGTQKPASWKIVTATAGTLTLTGAEQTDRMFWITITILAVAATYAIARRRKRRLKRRSRK